MNTQSFIILVLSATLLSSPVMSADTPPQEPEKNRCVSATRPLPATVEQAVSAIVANLDAGSREALLKTKRDDVIQFHMGWGMGIRNSMCLWGGNEKLIRSACNGKLCHPDDASMRIMEAVWDRLHEQGK